MEEIKEKALRLLARREYSVSEVRKKLQKKFSGKSKEIETVLENLQEKNLLSDARFCGAFIHDQILTRRCGPFAILQKLKAKGIDLSLAQTKLEACFPEEEQKSIAQELIKRKQDEIQRSGKKISDYEVCQKVQQYIMGRGFDLRMIDYKVKE